MWLNLSPLFFLQEMCCSLNYSTEARSLATHRPTLFPKLPTADTRRSNLQAPVTTPSQPVTSDLVFTQNSFPPSPSSLSTSQCRPTLATNNADHCRPRPRRPPRVGCRSQISLRSISLSGSLSIVGYLSL
jgi:hypothetical protein